MSTGEVPFAETPLEAIAGEVRNRVIVEGRVFEIDSPDQSDLLLDHPAVRAAFSRDEYMPYWADLWPAARMLAKAILQQDWPVGLHALEIGCGLGFPGIAALAKGLRVTFTDCDRTALHFADRNARLNGYTTFELLPLDWRRPPAGLQAPLLLGSDLIFEVRNVVPLVALIKALLAPGGTCLLTDQDRVPSHVLRETLTTEGLTYTTRVMHAGQPGGTRVRGTLYRVTHGSGEKPEEFIHR